MTSPTIDLSSLNTVEEISKAFKQIVIEANGLKGVQSGLINQYDAIVNKAKQIKDETEKTVALQELQKIAAKNVSDLNTLGSLASQAEAFHKAKELAITTNASKEIQDSLNQQYLQHLAQSEILRNNLGITGDILKAVGKDRVLNTNITDEIKKRLIESEKLEEHLRKQKENSEKTKAAFIQIGKEVTGIGPEMFTFTGLLSLIIQQFGAIENAAFAVRQNMGLLINDVGADGLYGIVQNVSNEFANIGVTAEIVGKSINSISNAFGNSAFASKEIVTNLSALEASFGISGDTSAKVLKSMMGISQSSAKSQVSMIGFAKEFSNAAGVPLTEVMKDLSTLSESVRTTFRGSTLQLVKSTVEARKLGLTISEAGNVAEKLLNFTESINAEIEASVMLGRNISFQDARTLAYKGDILGATKNILDTIEQTTDLNKLDALQLKSISEASGLTVGQLQDSLQLRKDLKQLQLSGNADAQEQLDTFKQLNGMGKEAAATAGDAALKRIKETNNLARQKQIQAELLGLLYKAADVLMPIFKGVGLIAQGINWLNNGLRVIVGETAGAWVSGIVLAGAAVIVLKSHWLSMFSSILTKIPVVSKALNAIGMGSSAAGAAGASKSFGKGAMFAGVGSFLKSLGTTATIMGAAASLYILAEALKNMPTDLGGLSIGEYMRDIAGGLLYLSGALAIMAVGIKFIAIGAGALTIMSIGLGAFGLSLQSIANPIKTFSDSFSKLIDNINTDNLSKMKDGVVAVKEAMTELRGELRKFNKDDLSVLDKLGNLTTNVSTATETVKKNNYADLTNAIVTAIRTGMSNIQITVKSDGTIIRNFREETTSASRSGFNGVSVA